MEYVNPTSIAQMAQVPKDTSLPGTGYGLMQGWKEGEAMAKAKDFLSLSQAAQAQDYVKQQFDMQSKWEDRPFELRKRQTDLEGAQLGNQKTKFDIEQAHKAAKRDNMTGHLKIVGAYSSLFRNAKTYAEKLALYEHMRNQLQRGGYPPDDDFNYPYSKDEKEQSVYDANVQRYMDAAEELTIFDRDYGQKSRLQGTELDFRGNQGDKDRSSRESMNRLDNDTQLAIARMRESGQNSRESGTKQYQQWRAEMGAAWQRAQRKMQAGEPLTAEDKAALVIGPQALAGGAYGAEVRTDPNRIGAGAQAKKEGEWKALQGILNPAAPPGNPLPPQPSLNETPLPANPGAAGGFNGQVIKYDSKGNRIK